MAREPVSSEDAEKGRKLAEYRAQYPEAWGFVVEWDEEVGIWVPTTKRSGMPHCHATKWNGEGCQQWAGFGTAHYGVGRCRWHDTQVERAAGAWAVAHKIAEIMDVSPWEALLLAVKRAAAWASFYDSMLSLAPDDEALRIGGSHYEWVVAAERVNDKLARWSKMAIDAGVAKMLVEHAQVEGTRVAQVMNAAISAAALDDASEIRLRHALRETLVGFEQMALVAGTETSNEDP